MLVLLSVLSTWPSEVTVWCPAYDAVIVVHQSALRGNNAAALVVAEDLDATSGACWRVVPTFHRLFVWEGTGWRLVLVRGVPVCVRPGTGECEWSYRIVEEAA